MSAPKSQNEEPFYVCVEVQIPSEQSQGEGRIFTSLVSDPREVFVFHFNATTQPVDAAMDTLLAWANSKTDPTTHKVELVVWNKDDFARLLTDIKWLSMNSICFISYYAALVNLAMQNARFYLDPLNLPESESLRVRQMAAKFNDLLKISQVVRASINAIHGFHFGFSTKDS